ncbi:MAG: OmpA family protein [Myxococcales bacterium]|nr:OmpA family protein [Myxococcales bacterium]
MHSPSRLLAGLSTVLVLAACKASVSLNAGLDRGTAHADAGAGAEASPPAVARVVRSGDRLVYEGEEIEFETDSAIIRGEASSAVLDQLAAVLKKYPAVGVRIEGHTDSRGSQSYNRKLSDERAAAIKVALVKRGVAGERLTSEGMGEDKPARPEPTACRNRSEASIADNKRAECHAVWRDNRRAAFVVVSGAEALPAEGTVVSEPHAAPAEPAAGRRERRPDWALRLFGGYTLLVPDDPYHGGHVGLGVFASQRFGKRQRGYIGGGPRLHYRGLRHQYEPPTASTVTLHEFGPEGDLLIGGGSKKLVGLFSLRVGFGLGAVRQREDIGLTLREHRLAGWAMGGVVVLGKLSKRWSLGGHLEGGVAHVLGFKSPSPILEVGLNVAWHFGKGRRDGI